MKYRKRNALFLLNLLQRMDMAPVTELLSKLELEDLDLILRERQLLWLGLLEHSSGAARTTCELQPVGTHKQRRTEMRCGRN